MRLAELFEQYGSQLKQSCAKRLLPSHRRMISAVLSCRTAQAREMFVQCPDCGRFEWRAKSCGNRNCPACQNHETSVWLNRQQNKLLPVPYFLVTFTVPAFLRQLAWQNQRVFYSCLFKASTVALRKLGADEKYLGGQIGLTGVLHTNNQQLDFHPHIHYIVVAGAIDWKKRFWRRSKGRYLFPQRALTKIFRAQLLAALRKQGLTVPKISIDCDWVVHCRHVGSGEPALKYLSRYLYRGVISEKRIIRNENGLVTFLWREGKTKKWRRKTLPGAKFLWLVVQHTLPRGFRRARDFGFLHGNSRKLLTLVQLLLKTRPPMVDPPKRPGFKCPACNAEMCILGFRRAELSRAPPEKTEN